MCKQIYQVISCFEYPTQNKNFFDNYKVLFIIKEKSLIKSKGMEKMLNKKLLFLLCSVAAVFAFDAQAVDVLQPEDEGIVWEVQTDEGKKVRGIIDEVVSGGGTEEIVYVEPLKPFRGPGLQSIPVPEEINKRAYEYRNSQADDSLVYLNAKSAAPRSLNYPIGAERRAVDSWRHGDFMSNFRRESAATTAHKKMVDDYKVKIADCRNSKKEQIDMEMSMLYDKQLLRNAAYLSETFGDIMQCYDDLGLEIVDVFYHGDKDVLRRYNQTTQQFEVKSSAPNFDTKYCQEGFCSMTAVAELQMEKFADFEYYLKQLLDEAPEGSSPRFADEDVPYVDEVDF